MLVFIRQIEKITPDIVTIEIILVQAFLISTDQYIHAVKPVCKGHCNERTPFYQGTYYQNGALSSPYLGGLQVFLKK